MNIESLVGRRVAEDPKDAQTAGHKLLLRGGYIRQIGQGIYSLLPLGLRACRKVERIIREEMDGIGGQEILMPVTTPAELWIESGRYQAVGSELLRFKDRTQHEMVLNMTHEEVVVEVARSQVDSYRSFPFMLYQIQTKFRDEARSRGGLIRVREFTMKDAYSFHRTQADLEDYYWKCHAAYARIFKRCGLRDVLDIQSDTGMIGGTMAHEFMLVSPIGEDTLAVCRESGYRANREVAKAGRKYEFSEDLQPLTEIDTPNVKTIEALAQFLNIPTMRTSKCVAFMGDNTKPLFVYVRGDFDVNQPKLRRASGCGDLRPMHETEFAMYGGVPGYCGPVGLDFAKIRAAGGNVIIDESVARTPNTVVGSNRIDGHYTGFNVARDWKDWDGTTHDVTDVVEGDPCPLSGKPMELIRGIEVGNIFQLGTKYSKAMSFTYSEEDGTLATPIMGCYGIGVGRTMASAVEESCDANGPLWPISIAPFEVQVCVLQAKDADIAAAGQAAYDALVAAGADVLLDKRNVAAGFMFADADLVGAPVRVILSKRNVAKGVAELKYRLAAPVEGLPAEAPLAELPKVIGEVTAKLYAALRGA